MCRYRYGRAPGVAAILRCCRSNQGHSESAGPSTDNPNGGAAEAAPNCGPCRNSLRFMNGCAMNSVALEHKHKETFS